LEPLTPPPLVGRSSLLERRDRARTAQAHPPTNRSTAPFARARFDPGPTDDAGLRALLGATLDLELDQVGQDRTRSEPVHLGRVVRVDLGGELLRRAPRVAER